MREVAVLEIPPNLSHTDGFSAVLKQREVDWQVLGHIDVEDMQFTDRRFVLAGFELVTD